MKTLLRACTDERRSVPLHPQSVGVSGEDTRRRCADCGDVLGVYEPIVVLDDGELPLRTSLLASEVPPEAVALHESCFALRASAERDAAVADSAAL